MLFCPRDEYQSEVQDEYRIGKWFGKIRGNKKRCMTKLCLIKKFPNLTAYFARSAALIMFILDYRISCALSHNKL